VAGPAPQTLDARSATWLGIGSIVGGGAIVLAGPAFALAGPAALLAVVFNAALAALAALALAELGARFPRSGGPYVFAQRVLGVEAAFAVGWLVAFASLAAAAVFALGFARFAVPILASAAGALGIALPGWATAPAAEVAVAVAAVAAYGQRLARNPGAPAAALTVAKVVGMGALGAVGLVALGVRPEALAGFLAPPVAPGGAVGVVQAMGVLFIAFQGFAIVPALAGDVQDPARTLPRASLTAVAVATVLYLPLFLATATAGLPDGATLVAFARTTDATMVADAAAQYLGDVGYVWVAVVAVLATLTALEANLLGASRLARTMARDRTLPRPLARLDGRGVPRRAVATVTVFVVVLVVALPEVRTAGAAAGLIYLSVFALSHGLALLVRHRRPDGAAPFAAPGAPATLWLGGLTAGAVAVVNAVSVPAAGVAVLGWLLLGALVYIAALRRQARALDAELESAEPDVVALRGRRPLVLAPIANPASAEGLVSVAHALAPPDVGRVTLLNVVPHGDATETRLQNAQRVLAASLRASFGLGLTPQALTTVADDAWDEIARVARTLDCESLLLGLSDLDDAATLARVDALIGAVRSDVVVLRAPAGWHLERCRRVVVPFAGRSDQERLRARVLGSLARLSDPDVDLVRLLPADADAARCARARRDLERRVEHRHLGRVRCLAIATEDPVAALAAMAAEADLLVLGMPKRDAGHRALGGFAHAVAAATPASCAVLLIHARR
jgi:amino acid transporter